MPILWYCSLDSQPRSERHGDICGDRSGELKIRAGIWYSAVLGCFDYHTVLSLRNFRQVAKQVRSAHSNIKKGVYVMNINGEPVDGYL